MTHDDRHIILYTVRIDSRRAEIAQKIRVAMGEVQTALHRQLAALDEYRFINLESEMDVLADAIAASVSK